MHRVLRELAGMFVACVVGVIPAFAAPWPQFRGPTGLGYTEATNLPLTWSAKTGDNVLWQSPLKGQGHASPIVWGDAVPAGLSLA